MIKKVENKIIGSKKLTKDEFRVEFKKRLSELQDFGLDNGYYIGAFFDVTQKGVFPTIGFAPVHQDPK